MILDFLKKYEHAVSLDDKIFDRYFTPGTKRPDFILFGDKIICEVKEFIEINIPHTVEKLARKTNLPILSFKRDMYNSINHALSKADKQIRDAKVAINLSNAYGLVILENLIPEHLSFLSLIDAADRKMTSGLSNVDAVLCLDFVNTFSNSDKKPVQPCQLVFRDSVKGQAINECVAHLISALCEESNVPFITGWDVIKAEQLWSLNADGSYSRYEGRVDFRSPKSLTKPRIWKLLIRLAAKWGWLIAFLTMVLGWIILK